MTATDDYTVPKTVDKGESKLLRVPALESFSLPTLGPHSEFLQVVLFRCLD